MSEQTNDDDKCYSLNDEDYTDDLYQLFEELDDDGELKVGATYYVATKEHPEPSSFFDVDFFLETANERAWDSCGEIAEDYAKYIKEEATKELKEFISNWADKNAPCHWYMAKNAKKLTVTQELIDDFRS